MVSISYWQQHEFSFLLILNGDVLQMLNSVVKWSSINLCDTNRAQTFCKRQNAINSVSIPVSFIFITILMELDETSHSLMKSIVITSEATEVVILKKSYLRRNAPHLVYLINKKTKQKDLTK